MLMYYIGGVDYAPGPYSISFFPNQTLAPLTIAIINDYVLEDNEMFHLTISASSLPNNVNVGKPDQATMIIEDDDGNCVILTSINYQLWNTKFIN